MRGGRPTSADIDVVLLRATPRFGLTVNLSVEHQERQARRQFTNCKMRQSKGMATSIEEKRPRAKP